VRRLWTPLESETGVTALRRFADVVNRVIATSYRELYGISASYVYRSVDGRLDERKSLIQIGTNAHEKH
jgi:hypothetical protein